jgi:uncharacterized membrane protein YfcA
MSFDIFFPIAGIHLDPFVVLWLGLLGGFASGMLGIGSGVIITPALMMIGVQPFFAVSTQLNNAIGTNLIGFLGYWRRRDVDFGLAGYLFAGGILGAIIEMLLLDSIPSDGAIYTKMAIIYVVVLGGLGTSFIVQNIKALTRKNTHTKAVMMRHWMIYFPWHRIFMRSRTEMSILVPIGVGMMTGVLTSTLGGGNSLFMMPIVAYLIGRTSPVVSGTTLLAGFAITAVVALVHGFKSEPCDIVLVALLLIGSTIGSQIGVRTGYAVPRPYLGLLGGFVILLIGAKFTYDLFKPQVETSMVIDTVSNPSSSIGLEAATHWLTSFFTEWIHYSLFSYVFICVFSVIFAAILIEQLLDRFLTVTERRQA